MALSSPAHQRVTQTVGQASIAKAFEVLKAISQLFQKKSAPEEPMNEAWKKHIKPILASWGWDNYSWVWEPFLAKYPDFSDEQRAQVEDALVITAFDLSNEKLAIKALSIAEELHRSNLASPRLSELFRSGLQKQFEMFRVDREISHHYVFACATFELKKAIPIIKSEIDSLEEVQLENVPDERKNSYLTLFRACCLSLLLLKDDNAMLFFVRLIEYDLRIKALFPSVSSWGFADLINFWSYIGANGLRTIVENVQQEKLPEVALLLTQASEKIHYHDNQEKQEVKKLIESLTNGKSAT